MPKKRVEHANQLTDPSAAGRRCRKSLQHINDTRGGPIRHSLNVFGADARIVASRKLGRSGCVSPCSENVFDLAGVGQRM